MIYTQLELLQSQPVDITKGFNLQAHPATASKIQEINQKRNDFYSKCAALARSDMKMPADHFDWLSMLTYLNDGIDLLEIAVKEARFPLPFQFTPIGKGAGIVGETQGKPYLYYKIEHANSFR